MVSSTRNTLHGHILNSNMRRATQVFPLLAYTKSKATAFTVYKAPWIHNGCESRSLWEGWSVLILCWYSPGEHVLTSYSQTKGAFLSLKSKTTYLIICCKTPKKQHCAKGGTNKWRQAHLHKQAHDKRGSLHEYVNRARLYITVCEVGTFSREISQSRKYTHLPLWGAT